MQHIASIPVDPKKAMINIALTQEELTALANLLDAGVKATGLQGVKHAASILTKLEEAVAFANKPHEPDNHE
jgi:hypothetical protein